MELKRWKTRRYELRDEDGDTAVIRYRPITQGWRLRLNEHTASFPESPGDDALQAEAHAFVRAVSSWRSELLTLWREMLLDLVVSVEGICMDGEPLSREDAVGALVQLEDPAAAFVLHLRQESEVSDDQGKR